MTSRTPMQSQQELKLPHERDESAEPPVDSKNSDIDRATRPAMPPGTGPGQTIPQTTTV